MKRPCERHGCANAARRWDPYCGTAECDALRAAMVSRARSSRAVRTEREVEAIPSRDEQVSQAASVTPEQPAQPTPAVPDCGPRLVRSTKPRSPVQLRAQNVPQEVMTPALEAPPSTGPVLPISAPQPTPEVPMPAVTHEEAAQKIAAWAKKQTEPWTLQQALEVAGCSAPTGSKALKGLINDGVLDRYGAGSGTRYGLPGQSPSATPPEAAPRRGRKPRAAKASAPPVPVPAMSDLLSMDTDALLQLHHDVGAELLHRAESLRASLQRIEALAPRTPPPAQTQEG